MAGKKVPLSFIKVSHLFNGGITCIFAAVLALADFS